MRRVIVVQKKKKVRDARGGREEARGRSVHSQAATHSQRYTRTFAVYLFPLYCRYLTGDAGALVLLVSPRLPLPFCTTSPFLSFSYPMRDSSQGLARTNNAYARTRVRVCVAFFAKVASCHFFFCVSHTRRVHVAVRCPFPGFLSVVSSSPFILP